jgi:hypothetical protein
MTPRATHGAFARFLVDEDRQPPPGGDRKA